MTEHLHHRSSMSDGRRIHRRSMDKFTLAEALEVGIHLRVDWTKVDLEQFRKGLETELQNRYNKSVGLLTDDDLLAIGRTVLTRLTDVEN